MGLTIGRFIRTVLLLFSLLSSLAAAPKLRLASSAFGPYSIATGTNGPQQTIEAYNAGDGSLALRTASSASWLSATIGPSGPCRTVYQSACLPIQLSFQTASLNSGMYTGGITISDPNAIDTPQTISVTVQIGGGIPNKIDLYVAPNGSSTRTTISSNNFLSFSVAPGGSWLAVAASGVGSYRFGVTYGVTATHQSGMGEGDYAGSIGFSGSNFAPDNKSVQVTMHVTSRPIADVPALMRFRVVQNSAKQVPKLNVNNRGLGTLTVSAVTASGGAWLSAGSPGTAIDITVDPTGLSPGVYTGSLALTTNAVNGPVSVPVELTVIPQAAPLCSYRGAVTNATYSADIPLAPGDIVALFGEQFSSDVPKWSAGIPLDRKIGTTRVLVNNQAVPLYYVSSGQINFQLPFETPPGEAVIRAERDSQAGNAISIQVLPRSPHLLAVGEYGVAPNYSQQNSLPWPPSAGTFAKRAHVGDVLVFYSTGFGPADRPVDTGAAAPPFAPIPLTSQVIFGERFGGGAITVTPDYVGMTGTLVGLYQVNVTIPDDVPKGDRVAVTLDLGGQFSNTVLIAIE